MTRPASISPSFSSRIPTCLLVPLRPSPASSTASERHPETGRKARLLHFLKGQAFLPSGLWTYRPVLIAWPLLTSWLASQACASEGERRGRSLDSGTPATHSLTLRLRQTKSRRQTRRCDACSRVCDPQKPEERGAGYMFNKKHKTPKRKEA